MRRITAFLVAILVVLLPTASPVEAASCSGKSHQTSLSNGSVSPGSATLGTPMTFSVRYADTAGCIPSVVSVVIRGVGTFTMSTGGTDLVAGVVYSWAATLPVGSYDYSFSATSGKGAGQATVTLTTVAPATAVVTNPPPPTPVPTPVPTPKPPAATPTPPPPAATPPPATPRPTVAPQPAGPGGPTPTVGGAPAGGPGEPSPMPEATTGEPTGSAVASAVPSTSAASQPASPSPTQDDGAGILAPPDRGSAGQGGGGSSVGPDGALPIPALGAALGASAIGIGLWLVAGRRRRDAASDRPAATTVELTATAGDDPPTVSKLPPMRELVPPVNVVMLEDEDAHVPRPPDEVDMPRWLRPSLRAARHSGSRDRRWDD